MAVYVSTRTLKMDDFDLARALAAYRAAGIQHIELSVAQLAHQDIRRLFEGATENYLVHGAFPPPERPFWLNLSAGDPDIRDRSLRLLKQTLYFCHDVGIPLMSFSPGFALYSTLLENSHPASGPITRPEAQLHLLRSLDQLANWSDSLHVGLALEVQNGLIADQMIVRPDDWQPLQAALQAPHLGILLDLGHVKLASRRLKFDPDDAVEQFLPDALACHIHGNDGVTDQHGFPREEGWEVDQLKRPRFRDIPLILDSHALKLADIEAALSLLEDHLPKPKLGIS